MKLTKLPNGTWIDLKTVTQVVPFPEDAHPSRVAVHYGDSLGVIYADDYEHAVKIAEDIAMRVNRAHAEIPLT